jgi:hypothetical protein
MDCFVVENPGLAAMLAQARATSALLIRQALRTVRGSHEMLDNERVAILCDIGQSASFADGKRAKLEKLIADGYVRKADDSYKLTPKGEKELEDRGAGLNES